MVTVDLVEVGPDAIGHVVRIYVKTGTAGADTATRRLEAAIEEVDAALAADPQARYGPSNWQIGYDDTLKSLIARSNVSREREDLFGG